MNMINILNNGYLFKLGIACLVLSSIPAFAIADELIKWETLQLNKTQQKEIRALDNKWIKTRNAIYPRLVKDQDSLKLMLIDSDISDDQIRAFHRCIIIRQEQLRYEALENFLTKRRTLNLKQRDMLQHMFIK